jgi:hypothetical protein
MKYKSDKTIREEDLKELKELESQIKELDNWLEENPRKDFQLSSYRWIKLDQKKSLQEELDRKASILAAYIEHKRLDDIGVSEDPNWLIEDDWNLNDELEKAKLIKGLGGIDGVCVIEEPLTCCDELPAPIDHTEAFNKVVGMLEDELQLIHPEEKILSPWYKEDELYEDEIRK